MGLTSKSAERTSEFTGDDVLTGGALTSLLDKRTIYLRPLAIDTDRREERSMCRRVQQGARGVHSRLVYSGGGGVRALLAAMLGGLVLLLAPLAARAEDTTIDANGDDPTNQRGCELVSSALTKNFEVWYNEQAQDNACTALKGLCVADEFGNGGGNAEHITDEQAEHMGQMAECVLALLTQEPLSESYPFIDPRESSFAEVQGRDRIPIWAHGCTGNNGGSGRPRLSFSPNGALVVEVGPSGPELVDTTAFHELGHAVFKDENDFFNSGMLAFLNEGLPLAHSCAFR